MNQSQFLAITCNSLEAREKSRVHGAIGFGFASHWLNTKRSNRNHAITFDSHLQSVRFEFENYTMTTDHVAISPCKTALNRNSSTLRRIIVLDYDF